MNVNDHEVQMFVECPQCGDRVAPIPQGFLLGNSITCHNNHGFNVFAVYRSFFENIPLARGIGEKLSDAVYRNYQVIGVGPERDTIDNFLDIQNFREMLHDIVLDTIIYGNSVVAIIRGEAQRLRRVDLAGTVIGIGPEVGPGRGFVLAIQSITTPQGILLNGNFIHFRHNLVPGGPMGMSAFGGWFDRFYAIRDPSRTPPGLGIVKRVIDQHVRDILDGADLSVYDPGMIADPAARLREPVNDGLRHVLDDRRREVQNIVERDIFPLALGREWQPNNWPEFEMTGL